MLPQGKIYKRLRQILLTVFALAFFACSQEHKPLPASDGGINEITIIISDALWNGEVGDALRKKLAAPVDGLTQEEPLFTLNQYYDPSAAKRSKARNLIVVEQNGQANFATADNKNSRPQHIFTISGKNIDDLLEMIDMHGDEIIMKVRDTEFAQIRQMNKKAGLQSDAPFRKTFGIGLEVPKTYSFAIKNEGFFWLKKDIPSGNASLLVYKVPFGTIEKDKVIISNIINMRDSIGNMYIHGQEPGTHMVTEEAYAPYIFMTSLKDRRAFEARGNWEMENDFMNGPFLNYAIRDDKHQCYLVVEGFIYSPSSPKRDLMAELEAIIRSIQFL
ncbi:MAG: DUF4837 family protein [Flavobacterium sp.]